MPLESLALDIGTKMPSFSLKTPDSLRVSSDDVIAKNGLLIMFSCNHCPYAIAVWPRFIQCAKLADSLGINTVAINPNINPNYPEDAPEKMTEKIAEWGIFFPYLVDHTQEVARQYQAQCTPDIYLLKNDYSLYYHGRIDDSWKDEAAVTQENLKEAIQSLAEGKPAPSQQHPTMGCSIKWVN